MAKTNFTKVEGMLEEGLRKMAVEQLLDMTNSPSKKESNAANALYKESSDPEKGKSNRSRLQVLLTLQRDLKFLDKMEQEPYELFGITKKEIIKLLKDPETIQNEEWQELQEKQVKIKKFRKDFEKNSECNTNDALIEQQVRRHKTKRFNINDKWVPLS